jgi:hypothetical protein
VALRRGREGPSLFIGVPGVTSDLLRLAAREAGVHLFTESDCNVYANGPYLMLHAARDGVVDLDTGRAGPIRDLFSGAVLGRGPKIRLAIKPAETRVLVVEE